MRNLFFILFAAVATLTAGAQSQDAKADMRMKATEMIQKDARRKAESLMLDDKTSEKFVKLYTEYRKGLMELKGHPGPHKQGEGPKAAKSDEEILKDLDKRFANERKALELKEKYYKEFKKILNARQLKRFYTEDHRPGRWHKGRKNDMHRPDFHKKGLKGKEPGTPFDKRPDNGPEIQHK